MGLRITFVLPHLCFSGGNKIVIMYAEGLANKGHDVTVVHGQLPSLKARIGSLLSGRSAHVIRPRAGVKLVRASAKAAELGKFLPEADVLIATWWETVEAVSNAPNSKGRKFHFVQGHEVWPYLPTRSADVYRLPFHKIAVSRWLVDLMRTTYGSSNASLVENPVEIDRFGWKPRSLSAQPTVGTVSSLTPVKNSQLAFEAVKLAREKMPGLRLVCFGADRLPKDWISPDYVNFHYQPDQDVIPELYRSCDYWLFTSIEEGYGLPILEAMAVGTPVIATPAGAAPDLVNEQTGMLIESGAQALADAIVKLLGRPAAQWSEMSRACRATAEAHDVSAAVAQFEAILCESQAE
jgi:glycosyltransferase involved in cell wall biosynthesis